MSVGVLKITTTDGNSGGAKLSVEGRLAGAPVRELLAAADPSLAEHGRVFLDLAGLTFTDADGLGALRKLIARGAVIVDCSGLVKELLGSSARGNANADPRTGSD